MDKALKALEAAGRECGLELSEEKNRILRIRGPKVEGKIGKYKIENEAKYLGVQIGGKGRDIFQTEKKYGSKKQRKRLTK